MSSAANRTDLVGWHTKIRGHSGPSPTIVRGSDSDGNVLVRSGLSEPWEVHISQLDIDDQPKPEPKTKAALATTTA